MVKEVSKGIIDNSTYEEAKSDRLLFENKKNNVCWHMLKLERILDYVNKYFAFAKILDVDCAQDHMSLILSEKGYEVIATDLDIDFLKNVKCFRPYGTQKKISFVVSNAENLL